LRRGEAAAPRRLEHGDERSGHVVLAAIDDGAAAPWSREREHDVATETIRMRGAEARASSTGPRPRWPRRPPTRWSRADPSPAALRGPSGADLGAGLQPGATAPV